LLSVPSITWRELREKAKGTSLDEKASEWASALGAVGRLRLAMDSTWLFENSVEETASEKFNDAAFLCACDLRVGAERAGKAMMIRESHGYVVLEDSKTVYAKE
jgi:hypothetical protein